MAQLSAKSSSAPLCLAILLALESLVAIQAWLSSRDHFLTATQMQEHGVAAGLPFIWHFGMLGDVIIISPLLAYITAVCFRQWRGDLAIIALVLGCAIAAALNWSYTLPTMPGVHVRDHHLTPAGIVHAIYMAIALSAFLQFFFFTPAIPPRFLGFVSILVLVHALFGTHMVLGVINFVSPLGWFPEEPLKSIPGWITVGALAFGLLLRNLGVARLRRAVMTFAPVAKWLYRMYVYWTGQDDRTTKGFLKLLDNVCGWVGPIFLAKFLYDDVTHSDSLQNGWLTIGLATMFCAIYFFSRHSAKRELLIGEELFVPGNIPDDYATEKNRLISAVLVILFVILYCGLVRFADYIWAVAPIMFVLACNDYRTRDQINKNMRRYFSSKDYAVPIGYKGYAAIMAKRDVASWFLFELDHLMKETARAAGCAIASVLAIVGYFLELRAYTVWAYIALIATLVLNEMLTGWWRYQRETKLSEVVS